VFTYLPALFRSESKENIGNDSPRIHYTHEGKVWISQQELIESKLFQKQLDQAGEFFKHNKLPISV